jgi:SpoVK/Ycf46/Vps4 family AAA+-type ATPase
MVKPLFFFSALTRRDKEADAIAKDAHGFVGADVAALVREAPLSALRVCARTAIDGL